MKKTSLFKKATAALLPLLLIFSLTAATYQTGLRFTVKKTVIADNLDFTNYKSYLATDVASSYYKDKDGSFVIWWEDGYNINTLGGLEEYDPAYDNSYNQYLIRVYPGKPEKTKKNEIREWVQWHLEPRIFEVNIGSAMWQNKRGNTVLHYMRMYSNAAEPTKHENGEWDYIFEEYDKDFKLINKVVHSAYDLPGGEGANVQDFTAKDESDNYYVATGGQILVFDKDFKLLGAVKDIPENPSDSGNGKNENSTFLMVNTGGDGAVYGYWFDEEVREFYKINPVTLTSKYMFDIELLKSAWLYPGTGTALFYGVGESFYAIDEKGKTKPVFEWGTDGIAVAFMDNKMNLADIENYETGTICCYEKDGNFYNFAIEDKDGDSKTLNDKQLVLYEFIRK